MVSLRFDESHDGPPIVTKLLALNQTDVNLAFDLDRTLQEIIQGVSAANEQYLGNLVVAEIQIVPNDYPTKGQAKYAAFKIAEAVLTEVG